MNDTHRNAWGLKGPPGRTAAGTPRFAALVLAAVLSAAGLGAQEASARREPVRLNPDEAVERAIQNNLSLESARLSSAAKKRASDLSWNQFIPSVTVGGSLILDNEKAEDTVIRMAVPKPAAMGGQPGSAFTYEGVSGMFYPDASLFISDPIAASQWHIAGSIQASLTVSIAMFENMNRLRLDYQGGLISYEKTKAQLERDVRKAYNSLLLLQENINLLKESYDAAQRRVQMAQANYNAGLAPELTLLQARVAVENMKPTLDQAENGLRLAMAQFAMFLGLPFDTPFELAPVESETVFIALDVSDMISRAASGKPDIMELKQSILMLRSARRTQAFSLLPSLSLSWGATPVFIGDPWKDDWGEDNLWNKSGSLTIALGLRLHSLIPFSADFQGIKAYDDQIKTAAIALSQTIQGTEIEVYNTVLSLNRTRINAEAQQQTVDLAERSYRLTEEAYHAGLQDLLQVQNAELELKQARVAMLEQQFNYLNGLIDLEYSIGVPFGTLVSKGETNK